MNGVMKGIWPYKKISTNHDSGSRQKSVNKSSPEKMKIKLAHVSDVIK